jgi:RNA polymerase sigma-54 factor
MGQQLLLLPQMLQSIEFLVLPLDALEARLSQAFAENEALEFRERRRKPRAREQQRSDGRQEWLAEVPSRERGLAELMEEQICLLDLDPAGYAWLRFLIALLDESGYLSLEDARLLELAAEQGLAGGSDALGLAIARLQALEPRGIGARNLRQALQLQLDRESGDHALLSRLLGEFLDELKHNRLPQVARGLGIDLARLRSLLEGLRGLQTRPAAALNEIAAPALRPDIVVERDGGGFRLTVVREGVPEPIVSRKVERLARDPAQSAAVRTRLRQRISEARALIQAIEQRRSTLARVGRALFEHQQRWLDEGPAGLVPLRMTDLANELALHQSTVSRAISGKWAQTPWGIVPLRGFFQGALASSPDVSREHARNAVRELVGAENARTPLSDDVLTERLKRRGFDVARRTVAKYREELGIPSSYLRRKH